MSSYNYKGALICQRKECVDVIMGKKWFVRPTERSAKWWVTVFNRFQNNE